ncbi:hypothetical protein [Amycolatopsis sp. NPDC098790]|uniref:hypothetical protein n=1 Tax=Amycolatopsis sp. NPDC098790 TaxID=3363939 RepID=UPI003816DE7C
MLKPPTDADLGQSLRLVRVVNQLRAERAGVNILVHNHILDQIAWTSIFAMQQAKFAPSNFLQMEVTDGSVRKTGFRADRLGQYWAFDLGNGWQNSDQAAQLAIKGWAESVAGFGALVVDKHVVGCGAARLNNSCVLVLAW